MGRSIHTYIDTFVLQLIPADIGPPESRIRIPESRSWMSTGLFLGSPGKRALWSIQDRDSGILIRDSGGAMSAGISCTNMTGTSVLRCPTLGTCGACCCYCVCVCVCARARTGAYTCNASTYILHHFVYICMYIRMLHIHTYMHIYTHTHTAQHHRESCTHN